MSGWIAAAVAVAVLAAELVRDLRVGGRREGKIDALLERLAGIALDHETRIREDHDRIIRLDEHRRL